MLASALASGLVCELDPRLAAELNPRLLRALRRRLEPGLSARIEPPVAAQVAAPLKPAFAAVLKLLLCPALVADLKRKLTQGFTPSTTRGMPLRIDPLPIVAFDARGGRLSPAATATDP